MFRSFSCSFSEKAKFKDKFIFNGGQIVVNGEQDTSFVIVSESESFLDCYSQKESLIIDWWVLDSLRLSTALPLEWYRPLSDNPFLAPFRFHFFTIEDYDLTHFETECPVDLIISVVKKFGATVADCIDPATTHIVTQFQCEHLLPTQLIGPVQFVTITWLIKILSDGKYSDPIEAIDFPCPIHSIPESSSITVCLSGFKESKERKLLSSQLNLMGIAVSNDLSPSTTVLICNRLEGRKFETAQLWGIRIVQKSWIDECYKQWRIV